MNAKELVFEEEARQKLLEGLEKLAQVVGVTLGPNGLNIGLDSAFGSPKITNQGGSILPDIELKDQYANMGVALGKEVAEKVKEACGDGTTTALILLHAFVEAGVKNIASGASPIHVKRGIEKAIDVVAKSLEEMAKPLDDEADIHKIAHISSGGDESIGTMIYKAIQEVGRAGVITIEEGKATTTEIKHVKGMQFDRGFTSAYFVTNAEKHIVEMDNPSILVTDKKITSIHDILNLLQGITALSKELLIIADDIESDALSTLVINKLRGTLRVCAVKAPGFGERKKALLGDIACVTGATLVTENAGLMLKDVGLEVLGTVTSVVVTKDTTTLVTEKSTNPAIVARIKQIEAELEHAEGKYEREKLEERRAKLSGGVAVIQVGAPTESEMKQKKQRFEDSLAATRASMEQGVLTGGGVAYLAARSSLDNLKLEQEEKVGAQIVRSALEAPFRRIVTNSGGEPAIVLDKLQGKSIGYGFNAATGQVEDLQKAGIIDPAKVLVQALKYAASSAATILLSEVLIGDAVEEDEK